jgi:hypothetical protein
VNSIVGVLTPNIKTAEDYHHMSRRLSEIATDYIDRLERGDASIDDWARDADSILVYRLFSEKAFRQGRGLFMTLEEIKADLWRYDKIEETIKSMIDRGLLKEVSMEWPPKQTPLCPFCGKPSAYPVKKKRLLLFTKISAWSCWNELCSMCGKHYLL